MEVFRDLEYGKDSEAQKLDLYLPTYKDGPFPLVVFIHGGGWQIGDKNDGQENMWKGLVNNGYALASINYRLAPEGKHPDGLLDCKLALKYLKDNATKYDLDLDNVAVTGNSAGGHYALMLATTVNNPKFNIDNRPDLPIKCAAVLFAPTDFYEGKKEIFNSLVNRIKYGLGIVFTESYFGSSLEDIKDDILIEASPAEYIDKNIPYILLQQGTGDFIVPYSQAETFVNKAKEAGVEDRVILETFKGAGHMDAAFETLKNKVHIRKFLDKHLKNKG